MAGKFQLDELTDKILNREFSYDLNGDAFYNQYKDKFTQQGKMAMMDTMGQAAALTGGYGSSYAQQVGQQTYQGHLQNLNDVVPELYQLARDNYDREGDALAQKFSLLANQEKKEYEWHRDQVADEQYWAKVSDQRELDAATLMAQSGDYSRLAKFYGLSEKEVKGLLETQSGTATGNDGGMTFDQAMELYKVNRQNVYLLRPFMSDDAYWKLDGALQNTDRVTQLQEAAEKEYKAYASQGDGLQGLASQKAIWAAEEMAKKNQWYLSEGEQEALIRYLEQYVFKSI